MRLWSLSFIYLDKVGLSRCFNEGKIGLRALLEAQKGNITSYYRHSQLIRFKESPDPLQYLSNYLWFVYWELLNRSMVKNGKFNKDILLPYQELPKLTVTKEQIEYEYKHLQRKLYKRCKPLYNKNKRLYQLDLDILDQRPSWEGVTNIRENKLFLIIPGKIESWERVKEI
jgi:hypothetical protein